MEPSTTTPELIGYFAKRTSLVPEGWNVPGAEEICSVSECISRGPEDWIEHWRHNDLFVYDSPELAWSVVPENDRCEYDLYAYRIFPVIFQNGEERPFAMPPLNTESLPDSFVRLGYDVVGRSSGTAFDCSPLSCNGMAEQIAVNRYCLLDDPGLALKHAAEFEASGCEPGPYLVVEVWRQNRRIQRHKQN